MKGWTVEAITAEGAMRLADLPEPVAGPGQYVVAVEAAGLNFLDSLMLRGQYQVKPALPFTPASRRSAGWWLGARAPRCRWGPASPPAARAPMPSAWWPARPAPSRRTSPPPRAVSLFGVVYCTAWHALHNRAALQPGETVLVHAAAGGVGSATVQLAAAHGCPVLATAGGPHKVAVAREMGAGLAIDYGAEDWVEAVRGHTKGRGADVIFDPVAATWASAACAAWPGTGATW